MSSRLLGSILIVGAVVLAVNGTRSTPLDMLGSAAYVVWGIGGIAGIVGLLNLNALGANPVARALGFIPIIGFAAFVLADGLRLIGLIQSSEPLYDTLAAIAWIGMLAGMLIVGILTIAAKTWKGWRRFVPLLAIVILPIGFGVDAAMGSQTFAGMLVAVPWVLLGYVIASAAPVSLEKLAIPE